MIDRSDIGIRGIQQISAARQWPKYERGVKDFSQVEQIRPGWALAGAKVAGRVLTMFTGTVLRTIRSKSQCPTPVRASIAPTLFASIASIL